MPRIRRKGTDTAKTTTDAGANGDASEKAHGDQQQARTPLMQEDFVNNLVFDDCMNPPAVRVFVGYLGKSPRNKTNGETWHRLYFTLDFTEFIEVEDGAVLDHEKTTGLGLPVEGTILWVRSDAKIWYTQVQSRPMLATDFLRGPIASQHLGQSQSALLRSVADLVDTPSWSAGCG